jgi:hypothetical protein
MRHQQQVHSARRRSDRCVAIAVQEEQFELKVLRTVAFVLAGAIAALWLAYLLTLAGSVLGAVGAAPQHLTSNAVNRLHKGDQLAYVAGPGFATRWSGLAAVGKPAQLTDAHIRLAAAA